MLNIQAKRITSIKIGDTVVLNNKISNASLNLYQKTKIAGLTYIHCACNIKTGMIFTIVSKFGNGFFIKEKTSGVLYVIHPNDLRVL